MNIFQTYKNVCRQITLHSCTTLENLGSFCCLRSPKNIVTNWQKVPTGLCHCVSKPLLLWLKCLCSGLLWEHATSFIPHCQVVFQGSLMPSCDMSLGNIFSLCWIQKQVVSDWQPSGKIPCDSFKDTINWRIPLPRDKFTLKPQHHSQLEKIPRPCGCRSILKTNRMRCWMADTSLTSMRSEGTQHQPGYDFFWREEERKGKYVWERERVQMKGRETIGGLHHSPV